MSARPSTPFPHTHTLSHGATSPKHNSYFAQPLHFHQTPLPTRTPPSLLKRGSSSESTNSHIQTHTRSSSVNSLSPSSSIGSSNLSRRSSSSTSTTSPSSPQMPTTPHLLPVPSSGFNLPEPEYNWTLKESITSPIFTTTSTSFTSTKTFPNPFECVSEKKQVRPKFVRRDTPRPVNALGMLPIMSMPMERGNGRKLTSAVDGGEWIVRGY